LPTVPTWQGVSLAAEHRLHQLSPRFVQLQLGGNVLQVIAIIAKNVIVAHVLQGCLRQQRLPAHPLNVANSPLVFTFINARPRSAFDNTRLCLAGTYSSSNASTMCSLCPAGWTNYNPGSKSCPVDVVDQASSLSSSNNLHVPQTHRLG
jgi:hypothetical protein